MASNEMTKCRHRLVQYCRGKGLDLGCGNEKITPMAMGIDLEGGDKDLTMDAGDLGMFAPGYFDYIFSSHCLGYFLDTEKILKQWWRVLRLNGYLVLYLPHKDFRPKSGDILHDFISRDILKILKKFARFETVRAEDQNSGDEYSFDLVVKKTSMQVKP